MGCSGDSGTAGSPAALFHSNDQPVGKTGNHLSVAVCRNASCLYTDMIRTVCLCYRYRTAFYDNQIQGMTGSLRIRFNAVAGGYLGNGTILKEVLRILLEGNFYQYRIRTGDDSLVSAAFRTQQHENQKRSNNKDKKTCKKIQVFFVFVKQ